MSNIPETHLLAWRIRFQMDDGRMITHFVATDAGGLVLETPAIKVHEPTWIGQPWLALLYVLAQTKKELSCQLFLQGMPVSEERTDNGSGS